ncbi:Ppx/GppA family phosphatase [Rufibacter immobilis]|uniref:Ppx/GppA family phosphatase n=1 Tax=Rufibacter immobilis TaxID=1348778 RepID=A0A3M9N5G8_9BACT|nr:Ppx/GppA phosphatase family protein [Rufibacter immobilis]RNI33051.1 Ppx/GppA family phosphatase [Rufibacter immobilis]
MRRFALIDLGTNTFHLLIVELDAQGGQQTLYKTKIPVKLGEGGISKGEITSEARERGLKTLAEFREIMNQHQVTVVKATATSALRNASNGPGVVRAIKEHTGIEVEIVSGAREAELIFKGVQQALQIGPKPALVMDIGGGSVEFIIGTDKGILWKKSFEIGAQRLLDKFYPDQEPAIQPAQVKALRHYLQDQLQKLTAAVLQHQPEVLIGSSGTFDTLVDMDLAQQGIVREAEGSPEMELPLTTFQRQYKELLQKNRTERLAIPGMLAMRVDMIVVACVAIDWVLEKYNLDQMRVSAYALKEGMLAELLQQ